MCFLKSDIKEVRLDPASISGILVDHPKVRISDLPAVMHRLRNKGFPYEANRVGHEPSYEVCEKLCVDDLKCVAFSFQKAVQECRRFSNVGEYFADSSFDSGFKRQLDE